MQNQLTKNFVVFASLMIILIITFFRHENLKKNITLAQSDNLNIHDYLALVDSLTEINENCLSPCWWNITLGEIEFETFATWLVNEFAWETKESHELINAVDPKSREPYRGLTYEFNQIQVILDRTPTTNVFLIHSQILEYHFGFLLDVVSDEGHIKYLNLRLAQGLIQTSEFSPIESLENLSPKNFSRLYGNPSRILLQEGGVNRGIVLVYDEYNFFVIYKWQPQQLFIEDKLLFCFNLSEIQLFDIHAFTLDRYGENMFEEILLQNSTRTQLIEDATNLTNDDIAKFLKSDSIPCLESPKNIWFSE